MIATQTRTEEIVQPQIQTNRAQQKSSSPPRFSFIMLFLVSIAAVSGLVALWSLADVPKYSQTPHPLLDAFDHSPPHRKLLAQLNKNRLSVVYGMQEDGLEYFGLHIGNKLAGQNRAVHILKQNTQPLDIKSYLVRGKKALLGFLGGNTTSGDMILQWFSGESIPLDLIQEHMNSNYDRKLIILASSYQNISGFKQYPFLPVETKSIQKVVAKSYKMKIETAQIIVDYFDNHRRIYQAMGNSVFNATAYLGQHHQKVKGLSSSDKKTLSQLCKNGISKSGEESTVLKRLGVLTIGHRQYWANHEVLLNYELSTQNNCLNKVATSQVLQSVQVIQQKEEQLKRTKEEELRKIEQEELRLQTQRKVEQARRKQQKERQLQMIAQFQRGEKQKAKQLKSKLKKNNATPQKSIDSPSEGRKVESKTETEPLISKKKKKSTDSGPTKKEKVVADVSSQGKQKSVKENQMSQQNVQKKAKSTGGKQKKVKKEKKQKGKASPQATQASESRK